MFQCMRCMLRVRVDNSPLGPLRLRRAAWSEALDRAFISITIILVQSSPVQTLLGRTLRNGSWRP